MGVIVKKELCKEVVEVRRVCDRVMALVLVFEEDVLRLTCGYALQIGRSLEVKRSFCDELNGEWVMHNVDD